MEPFGGGIRFCSTRIQLSQAARPSVQCHRHPPTNPFPRAAVNLPTHTRTHTTPCPFYVTYHRQSTLLNSQRYPFGQCSCHTPCQMKSCHCILCPASSINEFHATTTAFSNQQQLTLNFNEEPSSEMSMMGTPPSLISSLFWGRKRQTTLMLFPDMGKRESENETKKKDKGERFRTRVKGT